VPPWYISDDSCGPRPLPPVPFTQIFVVIFSTNDKAGELYRRTLRGHTDGGADAPKAIGWLRRFSDMFGPGNLRWMFAVTVDENPNVPNELSHEQDLHRDVAILPSNTMKATSNIDETSTEQLLHVFALIRDFQFRWIIITQQNVFVNFERLIATLQKHDPPSGKVLGSWRQNIRPVGPAALSFAEAKIAATTAAAQFARKGMTLATSTTWHLDPQFFALSRDVFSLLSSPPISSRLDINGADLTFGNSGGLAAGLNVWLRAFSFKHVALPGIHLGQIFDGTSTAVNSCPTGTLALHPVSVQQLHALSLAPEAGGC